MDKKLRCSRANLTWPTAQLPVEIFETITAYLTRAEIKTLRLVCREFEAKVSSQYFRNVVVPFRTEFYDSLARDENGVLRNPTSSLFSNGMRIFESFGPHIYRFALSLELDEDVLAFPPVKPLQEAIPAFWGVYRWPHETYHRYSDLEGLEQTADETESMKNALRCLSKVTNLGLCCDAGLGFLCGPDQATKKATPKDAVFAMHDWRSDDRKKSPLNPVVTMAEFVEYARSGRRLSRANMTELANRKILERMVSDAGYNRDHVEEVMDLLLDTENTTYADIEFDERSVPINERNERRQSVSQTSPQDSQSTADVSRHPLVPTYLSRAQKELLLELEWAHRAMIQSYVIGLTDNASEGCFRNLTTLTIAKIPSSHLHILYRDDLWKSIPSLKNVSLGVIADWRRILKSTTGFVEDSEVSPVEAVGKVFRLLDSYIGVQANIESIRFEWICGGEFAPSAYQRNQFILPAPFFEQAELLAHPNAVKNERRQLLSLPYVKHLSLKNCWASPHVLLETVRQMALSSLEKLEFESFSLSGPPATVPQTNFQQHQASTPAAAAALVFLHGMNAGQPAQPHTQVATPTSTHSGMSETTTQPEWLTWAGILEHFSPGFKVRKHLGNEKNTTDAAALVTAEKLEALSAYVPNVDRLQYDEGKYKLSCLSLKSCGYIACEAPFVNTRAIMLPQDIQHVFLGGSNNQRHDLGMLMQNHKDKLLGRILPYISPVELSLLEDVFEMSIGWDGIYDPEIINNAMTDGIDCPGMGRFSGILEAGQTGSWSLEDDDLHMDPLNNWNGWV